MITVFEKVNLLKLISFSCSVQKTKDKANKACMKTKINIKACLQ